MKFIELYNINVSENVKQDYKKLNYLSWAVAYKLMMEQDENATYEVLEDTDGFPLFSRGEIHFVKTKVTMFENSKIMQLPVMDNKHNAAISPNSRQVSDNIQRCLAKNIALFGIGLKLYTGEDLAQYEDVKSMTATESQVKELSMLLLGQDETKRKVLATYKVNNIVELSPKQAQQTIEHLKKKVK